MEKDTYQMMGEDRHEKTWLLFKKPLIPCAPHHNQGQNTIQVPCPHGGSICLVQKVESGCKSSSLPELGIMPEVSPHVAVPLYFLLLLMNGCQTLSWPNKRARFRGVFAERWKPALHL